MPPVAAAVFSVATAFISTVGSVFLALGFTAGAAGFIAGTILKIGIGLALGFVMRALSPKPQPGSIDQGQELRLKFESAYPREVIVGKAATGGSLVYTTVTGTNNEYLWRVIAISDCEIEEVSEIWGNGEKLTFSGDIHTGWRTCTSHFRTTAGVAKMSVRAYKGTDTDAADADLDSASSEWTSACQGKGVAKVYVKFEYNAEAFPNGEPTLMFVAKGAKIYDPRTATTVWTDNAALIGAKALRGFYMNGVRVVGLGAAEADIPTAALEDAADICGELMSLSGGGTERRYTAHAVLSGAETARELITNITAAMAGRHIDRGGEVVFLPGVARTPVVRITDADILADEAIVYAQKLTADRLVNTMVSTFVDPSATWQEASLPVRKDAAAITEDGDRFVARRAYRFVTSKTQGQRLDEIALREARKQARAAFALPIWAIEIEPGDWIEWESARFSGVKTFVVEGVQLAVSSDPSAPSARVQLSLAEIGADVFEWDTGDETGVQSAAVARPTPPLSVAGWSVTGGAFTGGGATLPNLTFEWTAATDPSIERIEIEYRIKFSTTIFTAAADPTTGLLAVTNGVLPGSRYEGRARYAAGARVGPWTAWDDDLSGSEYVTPGSGGSAYEFQSDDTTGNSSSGTTHVEVARLAFASVDAAGTWEFSASIGDFNGGTPYLTSGFNWTGSWEVIETTTGGSTGTQLATGALGVDDDDGVLPYSLIINMAGAFGPNTVGVDSGGARDLVLKIWRTSGSNDFAGFDAHFECTYRAP